MHLGNGVICPITGSIMITVSTLGAVYAFIKAKKDFSKDKIISSIVLTVFVFALQMINFSIPLTSSSGHIIGGVLLAAILGRYTGFLSMALIITIQALFFADGGLMALGCNIFNMGFLACFIAYPLIFKPLNNKNMPFLGIFLSSIIALQLGSIAASIEVFTSTDTPLNFLVLMQLIHLPIGIIEGILAGIILILIKKADYKKIYTSFSLISLILAGFIYKYASSKPDGLEWSLIKVSDSMTLNAQGYLYNISQSIQAKTAFLLNFPDYIANISGIIIIAFSTGIICYFLNFKKQKSING